MLRVDRPPRADVVDVPPQLPARMLVALAHRVQEGAVRLCFDEREKGLYRVAHVAAEPEVELGAAAEALGEAVGLTSVRVEDPADVRSGLERVLASKGPALLDVVTDPNVLAMPPKATIAQAKGFALAMTKMVFAGELDDVTDTIKSNWRMLP